MRLIGFAVVVAASFALAPLEVEGQQIGCCRLNCGA
jgi:hypothetical protein